MVGRASSPRQDLSFELSEDQTRPAIHTKIKIKLPFKKNTVLNLTKTLLGVGMLGRMYDHLFGDGRKRSNGVFWGGARST